MKDNVPKSLLFQGITYCKNCGKTLNIATPVLLMNDYFCNEWCQHQYDTKERLKQEREE